MKKIALGLTVLALAAFLTAPAFAADPPTTILAALDWQNNDQTGRTWAFSGAVDFPVSKLLSLGPVLRASYFSAELNPDPEDPGSLTLYQIGGQFILHSTASHDGLHVGVKAMYLSNDVSGYLVEPFGGFQKGLGDGKGVEPAINIDYSHPLHYGTNGGETIDLEQDIVTFAFALRLP